MRSSTLVKGAALVAAAALIGLSAAPAQAAQHVSQASATAVSVTVAGQGTNSGTYTATNDGSGQSTSGNNRPLIRALGGQSAISAGTLAQDAVATVDGTTGSSVACSGLAGQGATVVAAGDGTCLSGGDTLSLGAGSLDFSKLQVLTSPLFEGLDTQLQTALKPFQDQLTSALSSTLRQVVDALGDPALHLDAGAIQSYCSATGSKANGDSQLAGAGAYVDFPAPIGRVDLLTLPVDPGPNTHVVTNLKAVATAVENAVSDQLDNGLGGALQNAPLPLGQIEDAINNQVLDQLSKQLAPLEQNLLDITLNEQTRGTGSISVTALDLKVAPAARQFVGSDLVHLTVGTSTCGPNGRVIPAVVKKTPTKTPAKTPVKTPHHVPTVVTAGLANGTTDALSDAQGEHGSAGRTALVALLVLGSAGVGISVFRRALRR